MAEKCPVCGDEIKNGRCVFCGYRPTDADAKAAERYAAQKAAFGIGKPEARPEPRKAPAAEKPKREPPVRPERKPGTGKHPERQAPRKKPPAGKSRDKPEKSRPPLAKRLLFKIVVFLWIAAYLWLIVDKAVDNAAKREHDPPDAPYSEGSDYNISDGLPGIGSGGPEGGSK